MTVSAEDRSFLFLVNPVAGKGRASHELVHIRHQLSILKIKAEIFLTHQQGDAKRILSSLPLDENTIVVAVGGDGTVHEVGEALLERPELCLAVIPLGSGNDYSAMIGMSEDPNTALRQLLHGKEESWDSGQVGGEIFLNSVGFAFSSEVCWNSANTGNLTGMARYGLAIARTFRNHKKLTLRFDGLSDLGETEIDLMEIGIGNRCGGGFKLTANANPADGLLDVCLVHSMPLWKLPLLLPRASAGKHLSHPKVYYEQLASFRISLADETHIHLDGELKKLSKGQHSIRVRPKSLRVWRPQEAKSYFAATKPGDGA